MKKHYLFKGFFLMMISLAFTACGNKPENITDLKSEYTTLDDSIKIHYKTWGEGPKTMLFVHGFGCDMNTWEKQFDAFREDKDLRLVFVDLPGYGQSDKPHVDYTLSFFSKAVFTVLDDIKCTYTYLVGHSLGTPVCRQMMFENPARIGGLCDIDGVYCLYPKVSETPTPEEEAAAAAYEEAVQGFASSFDGEACQENITGFVQSLAGPETPAAITEYAMSCMPQTPEYVASSTMHNLIDRQWWNGFPLPFYTEVICTQNSGLEPDNREQMQALYTNMEYTELETCGHFIQMEQPELINKCLRRLMEISIKNNLECYEFGIRQLEENYAGFPWIVTEEKRPEYEQVKKEYLDSISMGVMYGPNGVAEMCCYMQDFHLGCSYKMWSNRFPMNWPNYKQEMKEYDPKPVAQILDEQTFLLRFPSCMGDDAYVKWTWDAVEEYRKSGCENLIVDIRGNGGGADWQYYPILQILYKEPGKTHGIMMKNTADNRERWKPWAEGNKDLTALLDSAIVHATDTWFVLGNEMEEHVMEKVDARRPKKAAIIIDRMVGSSGEQLLLDVRAVAPDVKFYGRDNSLGCIDISNVVSVPLPHSPNSIQIPTTVSMRVLKGENLIDGIGIEPDVRMDLPLPETLTDNVDDWVLWVAKDLKKQ